VNNSHMTNTSNKNVIYPFSSRNVHFLEQIAAESFVYISALLWKEKFHHDGPYFSKESAGDFWMENIGNVIVESLYIAAMSNPDTINLGRGPAASTTDAAHLRFVVCNGIENLIKTDQMESFIKDFSTHAKTLWANPKQFKSPQDLALELFVSMLWRLVNQSDTTLDLPVFNFEAAYISEIEDLVLAKPSIRDPLSFTDLNDHQPLGLPFSLNNKRLRCTTRRSVRRLKCEPKRMKLFAPTFEDNMIGNRLLCVNLTQERRRLEKTEFVNGRYIITAPSKWIDMFGIETSSWPSHLDCLYNMDLDGLLRFGSAKSPITPIQ